MTETAKGIAAIILACTVWGLSGLFYKLLAGLPVLDVLAHRTIWGAVFFMLILSVQGRVAVPFRALRAGRTLRVLAAASLLIGFNWMLFVWAIKSDQALEASLGYYIFPLVVVLFGLMFFGERLGRGETLAVLLAALAVVVLTAGLGVAPWIALGIALSFGAYGAVKKRLDMGPVVSVTAESLLLVGPALAWLAWSAAQGGAVMGGSWQLALTLMLAGPMTATPLILFSYGARRIDLASVGVLSYLNPSLQFAVAVLIFAEPFTGWHMIAFAMIWTALALYSLARWRYRPVAPRPSIRS